MINYSSIENSDAKRFLTKNYVTKERVSISDADFWIAAIINDEVVGVCGILCFKNVIRIKSFYVNKYNRRLGIGTGMLEKMINTKKKMSAFATDYSKPIFEKFGFVSTRENKGIYFMERNNVNV